MSRALVFFGSRLLLRTADAGLRLPTVDELAEALGPERLAEREVKIGLRAPVDAPRIFDFEDRHEPPAGFRADGLRVAYHALEEADFRAAGTARQKLEFLRTTRFCSRCAASLDTYDGHEALGCPSCGQMHFPRVSPAVIVLVQRGREALLGRSARFPEGVYSTLAGFVEPGESLEECAHREIYEEVGVRVTNLRYFGSQPHPFPHSLMVGFVADWEEGHISIDDDEIEDARWFGPEALPNLPHPMSIARALIEDFIRRVG
ncbi:MAG: NAD(+) diphosphatase [Gemmatimonadota bacterium]|nr:NAD(+) diphosphatase [Gemmatimonadota bacterium]